MFPPAKKIKKTRLDNLLVDRGLAASRTKAQALIMAGKVLVDGRLVDKAGKEVDPESEVTLKEGIPYVSRGGVKLAGFLDDFNLDVSGLVVLDVGASTGGFTDCLLQRGVSRVHAVDVGRGVVDLKLREDPRVHLLEGRNIRHLDPGEVGEEVDLAVIDVSFISLEKVLPVVKGFVKEGGRVLALVKPQFEVGKGEVGKGGIVRDPEKHRKVLERIEDFSRRIGLEPIARSESPIKGAKGNREFWVYMGKALDKGL